MAEAETDDYYHKQFVGLIKPGFGRSRDKTAARLKAERVAGLTPKQREQRRKPTKKPMTFRISAETRALITELAKQGLTATDIVELGVKALADARGVST